jgi:hypothetical protein
MGRLYSTQWKKKNAHTILAGKPEGRRPLGNLDVGKKIILI